MVAACAGADFSKTQLAIGFLQFLTTYILVGWIWSIYWGYLIVVKAFAGPAGFGGVKQGQPAGVYGSAGSQFANDPGYLNNRQGFAQQNIPNGLGGQATYQNEFN